MTWFTWRQFRIPALTALVGLAALAVLLAVTSHTLAEQWSSSGAATCHGSCERSLQNFLTLVNSSVTGQVAAAVEKLVFVVPPLIGMFWGAPLIARELDAGTHRLAWTQSVTRTRWVTTKLAVVGGASAVTAGLLSWAATAWSAHIDTVQQPRITPLVYGARGIIPIGYALFAFALGVTLGMLIRRTVPAMAATLGIYAAAVAAMPLWIRAHLAPLAHSSSPLDLSKIHAFMIQPPGMKITVLSGVTPDGSWVLSNQTVTAAGQIFTGPANPQYCGPSQGPDTCLNWVGSLGLRQQLTYQPAAHFWPLQWAETGIFVALSLALLGFCIWWVRTRLT